LPQAQYRRRSDDDREGDYDTGSASHDERKGTTAQRSQRHRIG